MDKPTVFISYNWGSDKTADAVEERLAPIASVQRDKSSIKPWGSIGEFMERIRKTDLVVVIISDAFLKSVACLYEIMQLLKDRKWREHSMFLVEDSAKGIYKALGQLEYITYWEKEKKDLENALKELDPALTTSQAEELKKIKLIQLNINEFMKTVADRQNPDIMHAIDAIEQRVQQSISNGVTFDNEDAVSSGGDESKGTYYGVARPLPTPTAMSEEAFVMLLYATVGNGEVSVSETISGSSFLAGGKYNLNRGQEPREIATWEEAVQALLSNGYIRSKNRAKSLTTYKVTKSGYDIADGFREANNISKGCTPSEVLDSLKADKGYEIIDDPDALSLQQYISYDPYQNTL